MRLSIPPIGRPALVIRSCAKIWPDALRESPLSDGRARESLPLNSGLFRNAVPPKAEDKQSSRRGSEPHTGAALFERRRSPQ
jgi:hypothetical protein